MSKNAWSLMIGAAMAVGGGTLYAIFRHTDTPGLGLRQTGAIVAVLGIVEFAVAVWGIRSRGSRR